MNPKRVLVVDDSLSDRNMLKDILEKETLGGKYQVETVCELDIDTITTAISEYKPDLIILDIIDQTKDKKAQDDRSNRRVARVGQSFVPTIIRHTNNKIPIILATQSDRTPFKEAVEGIRNGASDIIFKGDPAVDINLRVKACLDAGKHERRQKIIRVVVNSVLAAGCILFQTYLNYLASTGEIQSVSVATTFIIISVAVALLIISNIVLKK